MQVRITRKSPETNRDQEQEHERLSVSKQEAARMLGLSESKVHQLTQAGELACKRVGRRVLYPVAMLREFLKKE